VLVADDNPTIRKGLTQLLQLSGLNASSAADGQTALDIMRRERVDVLLTDLWMPRLSGLEVIGQLHDIKPTPKVILVTADDTPETLLMALRREAHQFMRKPIDIEGLMQLLHTMDDAGTTADAHIEVISARPAWIELLVSCGRDIADRIESYVVNLDVDLPKEMRETMGQVFRELLLDAMNCDAPVEPDRKLRVSYLRAKRMMMYRIGEVTAGTTPARPTLAHAQLQPGAILARAQADELLYNESRNEVVVVKYLD
jgi:CheY-like chemotaxis protein